MPTPGPAHLAVSTPRQRRRERACHALRWRLLGALAALVLAGGALVAAPSRAHAQGRMLSRRVGGLALLGPSLPHPGSLHYNPAVLGLLSGALRVYVNGTLDLDVSGFEPALIDSQTGAPRPGQRGDTQSTIGYAPRFYFAATSNLNNDSVHIAGAIYAPYAQRFSRLSGSRAADGWFDPAAQQDGRYHVTEMVAYHVYFTLSASLRIVDRLYVGATFNFVYARVSHAFVNDRALRGGRTLDAGENVALDDCGGGAPCGYGADRAAEAVDVSGSTTGLGATVGVIARPHDSLTIGFAFATRIFDIDGGSGLRIDGDATVRRAAAIYDSARAALGDGVKRTLVGRGTVRYHLPLQLNLGVTWQISKRLALDLQLRWVETSDQQTLEVQLSGAALSDAPAIPDRITRYQGFRDIWGAQLGARYALSRAWTIEGAAMLDNGVVAKQATTPLVIDGWSLDAFIAVRLTLGRFALRLGYGFVLTAPADIDDSAFDPSLLVDCVERRFDVNAASCRAALDGRGVASAAGAYRIFRQRFDLSFAVVFE